MARSKKSKTSNTTQQNARALWSALEGAWADILTRAGLDGVRPSGQRIKARCPYHSDAHASFEVRPDRGCARCYACAAYVTDPIALICKIRGCSYDEAARWLVETSPEARKLLDDAAIAQLERTHLHKVLRRQAIDASGALLGRAIAQWRGDGIEQAIWDAHLGFALPTIEWLVERRLGLAPHETIDEATRGRCRAIWSTLATQGLVGTVPPLTAITSGVEDSDARTGYYLAFGTVFGARMTLANVMGWPVLAYRHLDGTIGIVKVRNMDAEPGDHTAAKYYACERDDETKALGPGYYMPHQLVSMLGQRDNLIAPIVVEGETSVLAIEAQRREVEIGMSGVLALGGGQAATASIDALADAGVTHVRVAGDPDPKSGVPFIRKIAAACRAKLSIETLQWNRDQLDETIDSPDDVVTNRGIRAWDCLIAAPEAWLQLWQWCAEQAQDAHRTFDDPARRGETALHWGQLLRDEQDRAAYVTRIATQLDLAPGPIERKLVELSDNRIIPRDLSSPTKLVREIVRRLRGDGGVDPVYADGAVWRGIGGLWREVSPRALEAEAMALDSREYQGPGMDGPGTVILRESSQKTLARNVPALIDRPGYFDDAPTGVVFKDTFATVRDGKVVTEPLSAAHRARFALPVAYAPLNRDRFGELIIPCPRWWRLLFEVLRRTHCTCVSSTENRETYGPDRYGVLRTSRTCTETKNPDPEPADVKCAADLLSKSLAVSLERAEEIVRTHFAEQPHVCWPRDRVSPPTQAWLREWRETLPVMWTVMEFVGMAMIGEAPRFKKAMYLDGPGDNGKSVILTVLDALFPGATSSVPPHEFGERFKRARLRDSRLNHVDELAIDELIESNDYKAIIAGSKIEGEFKGRDSFEFNPRCAHVFATNGLPITRDNSDGFWTRALVLRMAHKYDERTRDIHLADYIVEHELAGIAAMALEAAAAALKRGAYTDSPLLVSWREEWRDDADIVKRFIDDATDPVAEFKAGDKAMDIYRRYEGWAVARGHKPLTDKNFFKGLKRRGIEKHKERDGTRYLIKMRASREEYGENEKDAARRQQEAFRGREEVEPDLADRPN